MKINNKSGFSLIEIMVATLVLAFLAVGGSAALYHTGAMIQNQEQKRMAVDQAMERLELVKRTKYTTVQQNVEAFEAPMYFVDDRSEDDLLAPDELRNEEAVDNSKLFPMLTTIERFHAISNTTIVAQEFIQVDVTVTYDTAGQQVKLSTIIAP